MEFVVRALFIGIGATVVMDLWVVFLKRVFGVPALDYRMVGRWLGHCARGRFMHDKIAAASPARGELVIGWAAHYAIGVIFAGFLLAIWGVEWARRPTLLPPLIIGLVTVAAPFFIMQPAMGVGIAASKTPKPNVARLRSLVTHTVFGLGLYGAAVLLGLLTRA
jgi:Protein of unknown function (DUF2938)